MPTNPNIGIPLESVVHQQLCNYIRFKYPDVLFNSDGAGNNLSKTQAGMNTMLRSSRAMPDFNLMVPKGPYCGFFLEVKRGYTLLLREKDLTKVLKGDYKLRLKGDFWDLHIEEQAALHDKLRAAGYFANFGVGFEDCCETVDWYMALAPHTTVPGSPPLSVWASEPSAPSSSGV
jgi:hypothetical protein